MQPERVDMAYDLVNGRMLNLQSRQHRGKGGIQDSDMNNTRNGVAELAARSESNTSEAGSSKSPPRPRTTPTKLPVLKVFTDKEPSVRNAVAAPIKQKGHDGSSEHGSPKPLDQERERYWRKVRDKLDKDLSASWHREKPKVTENPAYKKILSLANAPRQEIAKHKWKYSGGPSSEKQSTSKAGYETKPKHSTPEREKSKESTSSRRDRFSDDKPRTNSNRSASSNGSELSSQRYKSSSTTDSTYNSNSSVSPISGPSSMKEWEDRFVVHMPSAREPNPPTMNVRQITQYQKSIERVQTDGESMVDPDTLPSPRNGTPEQHVKLPDPSGKRPGTLDGQDSRPLASNTETDDKPTYSPSNPRYYCPDEVGKQRCSTIWEESSIGPKKKSHRANEDGSFLGCKEINGPHDRNPDEILYFSTPERPRVVNISTSRMPRVRRESKLAQTHQPKREPGETSLVQEEWEPIFQNLKHAQCSKPTPKVLCREAQCQQLKTRNSTIQAPKGEQGSTGIQTDASENQKLIPRPDDVFIITPTITRTMVTMGDLRGSIPKHTGAREPTSRSAGEIITDARTRPWINTKISINNTSGGVSPSGLRRVSQNSLGKSSAPSAKPLDPAAPTNIPVVKQRADPPMAIATIKSVTGEKPRGIRGFTRTPGIRKSSTESRIEPLPDSSSKSTSQSTSTRASHIPPKKSTLSSNFPEVKGPALTSTKSPSPPTPKSSPQSRVTAMQAKIFDVAELDGHQLDDNREDSSDDKVRHFDQDQNGSETRSDTKRFMSSQTFHMVIDMVFLFFAQVQGFYRQIEANRGSKVVLLKLFLNGILGMLEHCLCVFRRGLTIISAYNATGVWPKADDKDSAWLLADFGQAMAYLLILGFVAMVISRAVGVVILIGAWIMWFVRPFALTIRAISRILFLL
ncbi:putative NTP binding protein [Aspergillus puulaauensis]|uniref:NTP binding protein n=1 Tax=Aspergillus puulaauensis TaxID=1220207 RepID=A0A7R7XAX7_9EURO|nr:uncharacterized protein APUU_10895S [Aspergillus puulaauensis]BCS18067.1 hypothetical protein APUU_10895S [Aspergillus puulaauensis]